MITAYRTIIVDGSYLTRRNYEANGIGSCLGASLMLLLELEEAYRPCHLYLCWEQRERGRTFRHKINPGYKASRRPPPPEYLAAVANLTAALGPLQSLGWRCAWPAPGTGEADDVAATLVRNWPGPHLLWSADKDWLQLVKPHAGVHIIRAGTKEQRTQVMGPGELLDSTGLTAWGWSTLLTLAGDATDGIPGLPKVGAKRARDIIMACPDILELLLHGEPETALRIAEASDPGVGRYLRLAIDEIELVQTCWEQVRLRDVEMEVETMDAPDPEGAIEWCMAHDMEYVARRIDARPQYQTIDEPL